MIYGSTRDHTLSVDAILSDGTEVTFGDVGKDELKLKSEGSGIEGTIYRTVNTILSDPQNLEEIRHEFPDPGIHRRNTGYALDILAECAPFTPNGVPLNLSRLVAGSEGTLAIATEIKLNLVPLPPPEKMLVCAHFHTLEEAFQANLVALKQGPGAVELMDRTILELTKDNLEQQKNRYFVSGDPAAILIIEFADDSEEALKKTTGKLIDDLKAAGLGYHYPSISGPEMKMVWDLRKAGLGILSNLKGDAKPVSVIEDTAVLPGDLPEYLAEFKLILDTHDLACVYHAHIGSGELHLRPILNLKDPADVELFATIAAEVTALVKKYRGSLSGEHGDGRLRGSFIPQMVGDKNYALFRLVKESFDPGYILNPGKIIDTPPMNTSLRYKPGREERTFPTLFDFSEDGGILRAAERCNGSGDCRKTEITGGTMCPSYMATRDEYSTTRARANLLREYLTNSEKNNSFDHRELYDILDLCLSCKGCKSECPSNVDMAKLKAEFLYQYYRSHRVPLRNRIIANISLINRLFIPIPGFFNLLIKRSKPSDALKRILGFAIKRSIPAMGRQTLHSWARKRLAGSAARSDRDRHIYLYIDEFTNFNDSGTGKKAINLLLSLGYIIHLEKYSQSGRAYISKGLLGRARKIANRNIATYRDKVSGVAPLVGIEPSAILTFRDEYPELAQGQLAADAKLLAANTLTIEEFLSREYQEGRIDRKAFTKTSRNVLLHGHCQQKALTSTEATHVMLSIPENYMVEEIPSGCCGMAGSFGYEAEHYDLSIKVGELVLFPAIRSVPEDTVIAAPGTSCRHQISDGTGRKALHPVEVLHDALKA
jgi:Fe-S oxidoreductase/FAD/FMN-containing dehydrogenase